MYMVIDKGGRTTLLMTPRRDEEVGRGAIELGRSLLLAKMCLLWLLAASVLPEVFAYHLPWHQYYTPSLQRWGAVSGGRPARVRSGHGSYRMVPGGAELICQFPSNNIILSNVIWERADLGALKSLDEMFKRAGEEHEYRVISWTNGSCLQLKNPSQLARGLYRCIATGLVPHYPQPVTLFQDVPFYSNIGSVWRSDQRPCCRGLNYDDFSHHSAYLLESTLYYK